MSVCVCLSSLACSVDLYSIQESFVERLLREGVEPGIQDCKQQQRVNNNEVKKTNFCVHDDKILLFKR